LILEKITQFGKNWTRTLNISTVCYRWLHYTVIPPTVWYFTNFELVMIQNSVNGSLIHVTTALSAWNQYSFNRFIRALNNFFKEYFNLLETWHECFNSDKEIKFQPNAKIDHSPIDLNLPWKSCWFVFKYGSQCNYRSTLLIDNININSETAPLNRYDCITTKNYRFKYAPIYPTISN